MEEKTMLKEILNALNLHAVKMEDRFEQIDARFDQVDKRFEQIDKRFDQVDKRFDKIEDRLERVEKKMDGFRVELREAQETIDFVSIKTIQHEKKLREQHHQQ